MTITFYKNCCLNNKYLEVFYNTKLETYLNSLNKFSLNLDTSYYENNMELVIDYTWFQSEGALFVTKNIYDYNYCKITENVGITLEQNLVRYCFIKSINVKNGCVYLELEEDIWANFSSKMMGTNVCVLVNSRRKYYGEGFQPGPLLLPYQYEGNNKLKLTSLSYDDQILVYMLVEFQLYDLQTYDEPNAERDVFYAIIKKTVQAHYYHSIGYVEELAKELMAKMPNGQINGKNYQVGNIYAIPYTLLDENDFDNEIQFLDNLSMLKADTVYEHIVLEETLINDYKNLFIGTLDSNIKLINNGTDIDYAVSYSCCSAGISLKLNCANEFIDITNSFKYEVPFQAILSEEYATRKISNDMQNANLKADRDIRGSTMLESFISGISSATKFNFGGAAKGIIGAFYDKPFGEWAKQGNKYEAINAPKYSNGKGVISNLNSLCNIIYGIVLGQIEPDNSLFVQNYVDNFGYECFFFINQDYWFNEILKTDFYAEGLFHYNVIRLNSPTVYGSFTNEIAEKLNEILANGVKIWYDPQRNLDGYTDDLIN